MVIVNIEVSYDGKGWFTKLQTTEQAHTVGLRAMRFTYPVIPQPGEVLGVEGLGWLHDNLRTLTGRLIDNLDHDCVRGGEAAQELPF